eukprot:CAMPEP_0194763784 /NCGR_PEP_ID=MMETSP0323_2-20130528/20525_1 /TAXON_ID=2866 ORGANISM="Crypthecodinium cohnii, Strain Seligo" /NCGR_SAMPLE_ID=MMETSP0323_2 /ASSEMBLY_ACC=CAM_ASM_000346 /LENGTH=40 /DNA_ID= /DNA_START= /DNA_END= /DNA_ORIENTATION=
MGFEFGIASKARLLHFEQILAWPFGRSRHVPACLSTDTEN